MHKAPLFTLTPLTLIVAGLVGSVSGMAYAADEDTITVKATAEQELKQQPGVSIITAEDIQKSPPVNDLSEIIRKMPGVNLTGNSATGARGNNRQIDLRGMGPENTLILIDGRPVTSRNAIRYSWGGERDTRGDTNWVPVEAVERIEVLRGPAAARYGSGAAGGVVNIITKRPTNNWTGILSLYGNQPESSKEGTTRRTNFTLSGPLAGEALTMRMYGNINKTDADDPNINHNQNGSYAAGREGVRNRDINTQLSWKLSPQQIVDFDAGYSRQGNIYTGDTQFSSNQAIPQALAESGTETNRMYRQSYALTHNGIWDWGQSRLGFAYDHTNNTRLSEGLAGGGEGTINNPGRYNTSRLDNYRINGEVNIPLDFWTEQTLTVGAEWNREQLNDPASSSYTDNSGAIIPGSSIDPTQRSGKNHAELSALYLEDNIEVLPGTKVIPGLRFDYHNRFGSNYSPSLNLQQKLGEMFSLKAGIARVFKAPNLYQSSAGYLLYSRGNGCPLTFGLTGNGCYLLGNPGLKPETSINKEIGLEFNHAGYQAGVTYFRNDYNNKIVSGSDSIAPPTANYNVLRWENGGKAIVQGLEGSLLVPLVDDVLNWRTNATYMIESKEKKTGNPLSIIPKYTINTTLEWQATEKLSASLSWTQYGEQKPRHTATNHIEQKKGLSSRTIGSYAVWGAGASYQVNKNLRVNGGISNLFDKRLYRAADGASTYNEPGRAYYLGVTTSF